MFEKYQNYGKYKIERENGTFLKKRKIFKNHGFPGKT